jgi:hypothetical protein
LDAGGAARFDIQPGFNREIERAVLRKDLCILEALRPQVVGQLVAHCFYLLLPQALAGRDGLDAVDLLGAMKLRIALGDGRLFKIDEDVVLVHDLQVGLPAQDIPADLGIGANAHVDHDRPEGDVVVVAAVAQDVDFLGYDVDHLDALGVGTGNTGQQQRGCQSG